MNLVTFAAEVRQRSMAKEEECGTLEGYARLVELASKLGHNACLADRHRAEVAGLSSGPIRLELDLALKKIYGQPLPGEVVDVEASP